MNREETAHLLSAMAAFDRRTIGRADVVAWQAPMADISLTDGLEAVQRYYGEHTSWMMPAHVRRIVAEIVKERASADNPWAPGQYGVRKADAAPELSSGARLTAADVSPRVVELLAQLRAELPDGPRERLFPREEAWRREQAAYQRAHGGAANPHYRPGGPVAPLSEDDRLREMCRAEGPHDSGVHSDFCPDADGAEPHRHRASCHGAIGELLCGHP